MHSTAERSLTQPCMTAYCLRHNTCDPGISPGSANQCILGDMHTYLRSNLPSKVPGIILIISVYYDCVTANVSARM